MSEQIREQVSAFLDGELPDSETKLLLKRLTRDGELRESFGRYALIGEAVRGTTRGGLITRGFTGRVNLAIDGDSIPANEHVPHARGPRAWRPSRSSPCSSGRLRLPFGPAFRSRRRRRSLPRAPFARRAAQFRRPGRPSPTRCRRRRLRRRRPRSLLA